MKETSPSIFLIAGEASGDLHGSQLIEALKSFNPHMMFNGVGGPRMRSKGMNCLLPMEEFQLMGVTEVIKHLPKVIRNFKRLRNAILQENPPAVVFIDYPDFNLKMAKSLRKKGYEGKLIHYICPTIWAWRKKRIHTLCETLDLLLSIYPFERQYFKNTHLKVVYTGHPSVEEKNNRPSNPTWRQELNIPPSQPILGIFPGSRQSIVLMDLPKQLAAAWQLAQQNPSLLIGISAASPHLQSEIEKIVNKAGIGKSVYIIPSTHTYALMEDCQAAIATSGTVTLELALYNIPTVVVYEISPFNAFLAKYLFRLKLPHYCIVNILCQNSVFPELIQDAFTVNNCYTHLKALYSPGSARDECLKGCRSLPQILASKDPSLSPSRKAAKSILSLFENFATKIKSITP